MASVGKKLIPSAAVRPVSFSNLDKRYFPSGFTKGEMIHYYLEVAPYILPHLKDRPVTLIRFPDGVEGGGFYEKNAPKHAPDWISTFRVPRRHHEGQINYILINNPETLAWCANLGAIEFHPFLHRVPEIDSPTYVAFDLDPGEGADIVTCVEVALRLKDVFDELDLKSFPKLSGSKGIQVYVPLNTDVTYASTQPFAKSVAELLERQYPKLIVSGMSKALRKRRVMIDWSQNSPSKTTVCVYAMRGKWDEPFISMPLSWSELSKARVAENHAALSFTPDEALRKLRKVGDRFEPVLTTRQFLPEAFRQLGTKAPRSSRRGTSRATARAAESEPSPTAWSRYTAKRDFTRTAEPAGGSRKARLGGGGRRFVIQKHDASRLHYDFRLEMNGTLKSWAVLKGPPYALGVKRAAFEVEDHPLDYLQFEGTIPKGQYGGGTVMVWDLGTYELLGGSMEKGDLKLRLDGKKLQGEWHIFRIKHDSTKPMWLLVKSGTAAKPVSARRDDSSVLTRRSMARIARDNDAQWKSNRAAPTATLSRTARAGTRAGVTRKPPVRRRTQRAAKER
jgi:bifunctional non-homologous end joining protein LigD